MKYCKRNAICSQIQTTGRHTVRWCYIPPVPLKIGSTLLIALATLAQGVAFRAASFNIGAHFTTGGYPDYSLGAPGTPDHDKVRDVIARINPDVVALQEIASADVSGGDVAALAAGLGYPYVYISSVSAATPLNGPIDTSLRVAFLSRHPFLSSAVIRSPQNAKEITRLFPVVKVNVPGTTRDPVLISGHLKSGTTSADRFRRTVEMKRLTGYLTSQGLTADDNFVIMGDFNLSSSNTTFTTLPADLPVSFDLGGDITLPISYSTNPLSYFSSPAVTRITPKQLNGSTSTFQSGSTIDLFLVSPAIAGRPLASEVYNSTQDTSNLTGLAKSGSPLASGTSAAASDHYMIFADFELDQDSPNLAVSFSAPSVSEGTPDGTVQLTVTLPATRTTSQTVNITSDDAATAIPLATTLTIPAGSLSASAPVRTVRNFLNNGDQSVTLTASATGYDPASGVLEVSDVDGPYTLTSPGQTVVENFTGFDGTHDPSPWFSNGGTWTGAGDGTSNTTGFRSYGTSSDGSLGFLPGGSPSSVVTDFINASLQTLTTLQISYTAEQWRAANPGTADNLTVSLVRDGIPTPLPQLSFSASNNLTNGAIASGTSTVKTTTVTGLAIAPGASFQLQFTFTPGSNSGTLPTDVFINEFHYDNDSNDVGEFVEVVTGPGFTGPTSSVSLLLYNGSTKTVYATHLLSTFTAGAVTSSGHRFYSKLIPNIQNGDPDGLALTINSTATQFISYGGSFIATDGAAAGIKSIDILVKQTSTEVIGKASLGLTGIGSQRGNFDWDKFTDFAHTPGLPNTGQTLIVPILAAQGVAIDNLSVTFVPDNDADGIPDASDPDDDNDTMTDADEIVFGTDPFDAGSRFVAAFTRPTSTSVRFSFPTTSGRTYVIESSGNLSTWTDASTFQGNGSTRVIDLAMDPQQPKRFYRIRAVKN